MLSYYEKHAGYFPALHIANRNNPAYWPVEIRRVEPGQPARSITKAGAWPSSAVHLPRYLNRLCKGGESLELSPIQRGSGELDFVSNLYLSPTPGTFRIEMPFNQHKAAQEMSLGVDWR